MIRDYKALKIWSHYVFIIIRFNVVVVFFLIMIVSNAGHYAKNFTWIISFDTHDMTVCLILPVKELSQVK